VNYIMKMCFLFLLPDQSEEGRERTEEEEEEEEEEEAAALET